MIYLTKRHVLLLHSELIKETGGLDGLRDEGLLDSALAAPLQSFDAAELFPTVPHRAARLGYGLVQNHPFIDDNKRIGAHAMLVLLFLNDIHLSYSQQELSDTFLGIAAGQFSYEQLLDWIISRQV